MFVFKNIDKSSISTETNITHYKQNVTTASAGIKASNIVSGSVSQSYWHSLNVLFYTSGSPKYAKGEHRLHSRNNNLSLSDRIGTQHLNKFHGYPKSTLISVPSIYYGETS